MYAPRTDPAIDAKPDTMTQQISDFVKSSINGLIKSGDSVIPTKIFPTQAVDSGPVVPNDISTTHDN